MSSDAPQSQPSTPNSQRAANGSVLAFDFGEKRIGVAVADVAVGLAHPLQTIAAEDNATRFAAIAALIREWKPVQLIVGEPHHADGSPHETARLARRFAQRLEGRFGLPVALVDETLSSHAAAERLHTQGAGRRPAKAAIDAQAAAEILATWLAEQHKKSRATP